MSSGNKAVHFGSDPSTGATIPSKQVHALKQSSTGIRGAEMANALFQSLFQNAIRQRKMRGELFASNLARWRTVCTPEQRGFLTHTSTAESSDSERGELKIVSYPIPAPDIPPRPSMFYSIESLKEVLQVDALLSPRECQTLCESAEAVGFKSAVDIGKLEFPEYYDEENGSNSRVKNTSMLALVEDPDLAHVLWERLCDVVTDTCKTLNVIVRNNDGSESPFPLTAVGVCPLMRVLKYSAGQKFDAHSDGVDYAVELGGKKGRYRSLVTLAVYLNDGGHGDGTGDFDGGALHFVQPPRLVKRDLTSQEQEQAALRGNVSSLKRVYDPYSQGEILVQPAVGRAALFHQDEHHEARALTRGFKYMIQTSIMYQLPDCISGWQ